MTFGLASKSGGVPKKERLGTKLSTPIVKTATRSSPEPSQQTASPVIGRSKRKETDDMEEKLKSCYSDDTYGAYVMRYW